MSTATGTLTDGITLRSRPVTLEFTSDGRLLISGEDLGHDLPLADVRVSDRLGAIPRFLYLPGALVVETLDNAAVDAALAQAKRGRAAGLIHFLETRSAIAAVATILLIAMAGSGLYFGLPRLARRIAYATPPAIETEAGRVALKAIGQHLSPSTLTQRERNRVRSQLSRLLPNPKDSLPKLHFRSMGGGSPNAFALPGNFIVITDEFVRLATHDDEIAAVLAHELGHLEKHHGLQSVLRSSFALLFVTSLTGDLSTLTSTSFAATMPFMLLQNGYSRDLEREADTYAHDLMLARGIPLNRFASILKKLENASGMTRVDLGYLSTHPSTDERVKLFKSSDEPVEEDK